MQIRIKKKKPVYYSKGVKRKFVSYCIGCYDNLMKGGRLTIADYKDFGYFEILDAIKDSDSDSSSNSGTAGISFDEAVTRAYNRTENLSYNGSGAELGVSMLKRYLGGRRVKDNNLSLDDKRLWEFRYKLQYEEPRVNVVSSNDGYDETLLLTWNKEYVEKE